jgi:hypothetical protein
LTIISSPSGIGHFSALDELDTAGLLNYFGQVRRLDEIELQPILLTRGETKVRGNDQCSSSKERLLFELSDRTGPNNLFIWTPDLLRRVLWSNARSANVRVGAGRYN